MGKLDSQEWRMKDEQNVWHAMKPYNPSSTMICSRAKGVWITDIDDKTYLDGMSGLWCVNVGYGRDELAEAAYQQLKEMPFYPLTQSHLPAIELGEKLNEWLGGEYIFFFSNSGSEANEIAMKITRQYHHQRGESNRFKFISRYRGYHGSTLATLAAGGQAQRKYAYEPLSPGFIQVNPPDCYRCPYTKTKATCNLECTAEIDRTMTWEIDRTIAAVIMEPIITGGGVLVPHDDYMSEVKSICQKHGALLIADEVICGFGRTGKPFGFNHYDVKPDIVTMAKGITSGYLPLSVTAVKREIFDAFKGSGPFDYLRHVNTFGGHPAACRVAIKNLEIMERENLIEQSKVNGDWLLEQLSEFYSHPHVGDIRGKGLLVGIELVKDKRTKEALPENLVGNAVKFCREKGVIIGKTSDISPGYNNILTLAPPLIITKDELKQVVETLRQALEQI